MNRMKSVTRVERADTQASDRLNGQRDSWQMQIIGAASDIADQPQMRLLCGATIALGAFRRDGHLVRTGIKMLAAHTLATWGKSAVKAVVDRRRPEDGDDPRLHRSNSDAHEDNSFPSGHSAGAIAVAQAMARGYPDHALVARTPAMAVSAAQIPRGTHYIGDVVTGALIGLVAERASETVVSVIFRTLERSLAAGGMPTAQRLASRVDATPSSL